MGMLEWLDSLPSNLPALPVLAFTLWRYLDSERSAPQFQLLSHTRRDRSRKHL